jgi:glycosyltransferase involved in cell wall biosynthesis
MNQVFFSIIVPTYNRANLLPKTLQTLLSQTFQDFEIYIIDDGSTDNTAEVVQPFLSDKVKYFPKKNEERAVARNTGSRVASGQYVNFFDSDDWAYPNHLQTAYDFIKKNNSPEIFHLGYDFRTPEEELIRQVNVFEGKNLNEKLIRGNILSCNGVFLRKDIALSHPFREERALSASEDWELWIRLAARFEILYDNTITSSVVSHENRSVLQINKEKLIKRIHILQDLLFSDEKVKEKFGNWQKIISSDLDLYLALHLAMASERKEAMGYAFKAFLKNPGIVADRRLYGIIKNLI